MILVFSSDKFNNVIREAEGRPDLHDDELELRFRHYCDRLFDHVKAHGVVFQGVTGTAKSLAGMRFGLIGGHNSPETIYAGLRFLQPVSVTVEYADITALVQSPIARAALHDRFADVENSLNNLELSEVPDALERATLQLMQSPAGITEQSESFEVWAMRNGLRIPGSPQAAEEEKARLEQKQSERAREWFEEDGQQPDSGWGVREL